MESKPNERTTLQELTKKGVKTYYIGSRWLNRNGAHAVVVKHVGTIDDRIIMEVYHEDTNTTSQNWVHNGLSKYADGDITRDLMKPYKEPRVFEGYHCVYPSDDQRHSSSTYHLGNTFYTIEDARKFKLKHCVAIAHVKILEGDNL